MKYAVKLTEQNLETLGKWRESGPITGSIYGYILSEYAGSKGYWTSELYPGYKYISWEQFQQEVMNIIPKNINYQIY